MANIMVNETCNLKCPYCFAGEFVNKHPKEMSIEDFKRALAFVLSDEDDHQVGIIGGEPLLYSHIDEALRIALSHPETEYVMLYTNAVMLDTLAPEIRDAKKFRMLVNCNPPEDMGRENFERMRANLLDFEDNHFGNGRFRLSVNIYKPDFDYSYIVDLVNEIGFDVIRLSVSVPKNGDLGGLTPLQYFEKLKPVTLSFVRDMIRCGVMTGFDCNFIPDCVLTKEERQSFMAVKDALYKELEKSYSETFWERSIVCEIHNCTPVIDILPDLKAIRCFGLSEHTKRDIKNYGSISELRNHYMNTIDMPATNIWTEERCESCYSRELGECSGGCLLFKADRLFNSAQKSRGSLNEN